MVKSSLIVSISSKLSWLMLLFLLSTLWERQQIIKYIKSAFGVTFTTRSGQLNLSLWIYTYIRSAFAKITILFVFHYCVLKLLFDKFDSCFHIVKYYRTFTHLSKRMIRITNLFLIVFSVIVIAADLASAQESLNFTATPGKSGVLFKRKQEQLNIYFVKNDLVRVQYVPEGELKNNQTDICIPRTEIALPFQFSEDADSFFLTSAKLKVGVKKTTGAISYLTAGGKPLFKENPAEPRLTEKVNIEKVGFDNNNRKVEKTANGDLVVAEVASKKIIGSAWKAKEQFEWQKGEALYGLGSHQEDYMNLRGTMQYLYQHNLKKSVPVLMSSMGYGLLFDVGSTMIFRDDSTGSFMEMNTVNEIDYYFMYGPEFDQIVSHYRELTGKVQIMPKYVFGYVQSKERYKNPREIDSVLTRFRTSGIPLDVIVQDWNYWKPALWGHKKFDENFYPDPAGMINNVHQKNAHYMLSIWPNVTANEETEMGEKGFVLGRSVYNAFDQAARKMYWDQYVNKNLFSLGVDAWWCDSSEPVDGDWSAEANGIANNPKARYEINSKGLNDLLGPMRANLFSLHHAEGVYENQRLTTSEKRVVNLTRSGFAGLQRYGTFVWNGDTKATWADFAQWIPSGLNYMATGAPYWTMDAGAFFVKANSQWFWAGAFREGPADPGYREFYVRNLQFCAWLPMMRSHGTDFPREPWQFGMPGEPFYESILKQINLRYRLLPYTYSVAAMVSDQNYTMTRALIFDFRGDNKVYDIKDQFMFGPSFMACPVTKPMYFEPNAKELINIDKTRSVYLPKNTSWIDFWTGKDYPGGSTIIAGAPIDHIPVFVKAGAIVPMGPVEQYASEKPNAPWEIRIYRGANGQFIIYEDEGDNYDYEHGKSARIKLQWDDHNRTLTIGERKGSFNAMAKVREFRIVVVSEVNGIGVTESIKADKVVLYTGNLVKVAL